MREENAVLRQQNQSLKQQLDWLKRQLFGGKSERRIFAPPQGQRDIGELLAEAAVASDAPVATEELHYTRRKSKQRPEEALTEQGLRFDESVPVEIIHLPAPELLGPDAEHYEVIEEKITRRLAQRPGSYVVLEYHRPVVKHKVSGLITAPAAPEGVFEKSLADVSLLAGLLVDKFTYHIPLYRQHQRLAQAGITLSRATLTYWTQRAIELLRPICDAQLQHILQSRVLAIDETPIKAGRSKPGKMQAGWLWPIYGQANEIVFTYSPSRAHRHLKGLLGGFQGVLLSDGYSAYDCYCKSRPEITQAQCWAHARRYFVKAEKLEPQATAEALDYIGALYRIEAQIREQALAGEPKLAYRATHAKPLAEAFFGWCREQCARVDLVNSNPLAKALTYVENHRAQMSVYLSEPDVPMDTNHLERNLRPIPMGRKNWLFCWTEIGAKHLGIIQSLLTTCRLQGVDPYAYLVDVLQRVGLHQASRVEELTPRLWKEKFQAHALKSDLDRLGQ